MIAVRRLSCAHGPLPGAEVVDAEVKGALEATKRATTNHQGPVTVCVDNSSVVKGLAEHPMDTSQEETLQTLRAARGRPVNARWVPGHAGVYGNEVADRLAKAGAGTPYSPDKNHTPTLSNVRRVAKAKDRSVAADWWASKAPSSYQALGIPYDRRPKERDLPRGVLRWLLAERLGYGDFSDYYERLKIRRDCQKYCTCG